MNRRSFMKAVSLAVAAPTLPVAAMANVMEVDVVPGESVAVWELWNRNQDGSFAKVTGLDLSEQYLFDAGARIFNEQVYQEKPFTIVGS